MKEGMEKIDPAFEVQKNEAELKNRKDKENFLRDKFSEILEENPVVIYKKYDKNFISEINKTESVRLNFDDNGVGVYFDKANWILVNNKDLKVSHFLDNDYENYKITENSFQTILNIMHDAIEATACSEFDKDHMFQMLVDSLKDKVAKEGELGI